MIMSLHEIGLWGSTLLTFFFWERAQEEWGADRESEREDLKQGSCPARSPTWSSDDCEIMTSADIKE